MDNQLEIDISFRLIGDAMDIFQVTLVVLFLGCTGAICLAMLMVQIDIVSTIDRFKLLMLCVFL